jgi:hypothetical protein
MIVALVLIYIKKKYWDTKSSGGPENQSKWTI